MFTDATADCPALIKRVKTEIEGNLARAGAGYSKYANFPSCSGQSCEWINTITDPCSRV